MIFKSISLSLTALAMSSTAAFAGSLANQQTEPPVVVAATPIVIAPVAAGGLYGALSFAAIQPDGEFTQDIIDPEYESGEIDLDNGFGVLGAVGYDLGNGFRVEAELGQLKADSDRLVFPDATAPFDVADTDGDITLTTGMINAWYDVGSFGGVQPFIGGGIGMAKGEIDVSFDLGSNNGISDSDTAFAWQVGAGVEIPMSSNMSVIASYRYLASDGLELTDNEDTAIDADLSTHVLAVGAMFRF